MAEELSAGTISFRPYSAKSRALLELAARHRGTTVSKLIAEIADDYARAYVKRVGADAIAEQLRAEAAEREAQLARQLEALLAAAES